MTGFEKIIVGQSEKRSNYDIMRDRMEREFAQHDLEAIIQKFDLVSDADHIYVCLAKRDYRIQRASGKVEWYSETQGSYVHADYNASMIIFDMLAWSKPNCKLDGTFVSMGELRGVVYSAANNDSVFSGLADCFAGRIKELERACQELGGKPGGVGDVSAIIPLFDFFPVMVQFWDADDEFDASLKFLWDKNTTDFIHYETVAYAVFYLVDRLKEYL